MTELIWADYLIVGVVLISALISLVRGFVREALSLLTWIAAFVLAIRFSALLTPHLLRFIDSPSVRFMVAFALLFILALIVGALVNFLVSSLVETTGLTGTDRLLGIVFGLGRGMVLIAVLALLAAWTPLPKEAWWQNSVLLPQFEMLADWLKAFIPTQLHDFT